MSFWICSAWWRYFWKSVTLGRRIKKEVKRRKQNSLPLGIKKDTVYFSRFRLLSFQDRQLHQKTRKRGKYISFFFRTIELNLSWITTRLKFRNNFREQKNDLLTFLKGLLLRVRQFYFNILRNKFFSLQFMFLLWLRNIYSIFLSPNKAGGLVCMNVR